MNFPFFHLISHNLKALVKISKICLRKRKILSQKRKFAHELCSFRATFFRLVGTYILDTFLIITCFSKFSSQLHCIVASLSFTSLLPLILAPFCNVMVSSIFRLQAYLYHCSSLDFFLLRAY